MTTQNNNNTYMNKSNNAATAVTSTAASTTGLRRGVKKSEVVTLVEKFNFPTTPFTLKEILNAFGVDHWYIVDYVKKNGKIVGDAPRTNGARGKAAKLYQIGG